MSEEQFNILCLNGRKRFLVVEPTKKQPWHGTRAQAEFMILQFVTEDHYDGEAKYHIIPLPMKNFGEKHVGY